ncbi:hypothetical protein Krac_11582 [Ktedonobacter racemifer DSM 44963]|uniref:Uncharacterized protein n=1 Tax=Ktedonobacter racemifer DSM 44963 TaxID=485913 RepID=D6TCH2_KTERA|nr:hypothetical protein Krac_11582 [Ktedonobacter racemifer DSM 44963]
MRTLHRTQYSLPLIRFHVLSSDRTPPYVKGRLPLALPCENTSIVRDKTAKTPGSTPLAAHAPGAPPWAWLTSRTPRSPGHREDTTGSHGQQASSRDEVPCCWPLPAYRLLDSGGLSTTTCRSTISTPGCNRMAYVRLLISPSTCPCSPILERGTHSLSCAASEDKCSSSHGKIECTITPSSVFVNRITPAYLPSLPKICLYCTPSRLPPHLVIGAKSEQHNH